MRLLCERKVFFITMLEHLVLLVVAQDERRGKQDVRFDKAKPYLLPPER